MTKLAAVTPQIAETLKSKIRHVPDFPKPGILFYDITTLLRDPDGFRLALDSLAGPFEREAIDLVDRHREPRFHPGWGRSRLAEGGVRPCA